ncbi:MAG TPA: DUF5071 domain-containing protein [Fibrobacteria bacterium]|nr:DUF5071 domain-containing protein [Fibrobacteria bacterium]
MNEAIMMMPSDKSDIESARSITKSSGSWSEEELFQILEWVQDGNWPVARILLPYLKTLKQDLNRQILTILDTQDHVWMYWVIDLIDPTRMNDALRERLERIANSPTRREEDEGLPEKRSPSSMRRPTDRPGAPPALWKKPHDSRRQPSPHQARPPAQRLRNGCSWLLPRLNLPCLDWSPARMAIDDPLACKVSIIPPLARTS